MLTSIVRYISVAIAGLLMASVAAAAEATLTWRDKVDSGVLEKVRPGGLDFLVLLEEQADLSAAAELGSKLEKGTFVFETLREVANRTQPPIVEILERESADYKRFWAANMIWVSGDSHILEILAGRPDVARLCENASLTIERPVRVDTGSLDDSGDESGSRGVIEWNISIVNAPRVWAEGVTGEGAVVAGIDTGYDWTHPALKNQYRGWNGVSADHNYNWHDAVHGGGVICPADSPEPCDEDTHGTHTMGTMVGDDGGNHQVGMAPGAKWIGCRCWERAKGTDIAYVTECLEWVIAPTGLGKHLPDPAKAPHVVNNSWVCTPTEGCGNPNSLKLVIENVRAAGIVVLGGVGNDGPHCSSSFYPPAIYERYFSIGATTIADEIASFSSRGPVTIDGSGRTKPDICAPGQGVRSTFPGGAYAIESGTSMAGPHVAGLVALLISANPELAGDVDLIEEIITETAVFLPTEQECGEIPGSSVPNNTIGHGRIDAYAAYERAMELAGPTVSEFRLQPNFPNPFSSVTSIRYSLLNTSDVQLRIYDAAGRLVRNLVNVVGQLPDSYETSWNGRDDNGLRVPSGVYLCKLDAGDVTRSRRIVFIR